MLTGLCVFVLGRDRFAGLGLPPSRSRQRLPARSASAQNAVYAGLILVLPILGLLVLHNRLTGWLLIAVGTMALAWLSYLVSSSPRIERERLSVIIVLTFFAVVFFAFFEQAGSSINLFTDRNIERTLFGWNIPASMFQAVNPLFIILLAPLFSALWLRLSDRGLEPSTPVKFALGILQLALGFWMLSLGAQLAGVDGRTSMLWLLLGYLFITTGELSLSPVGLAMVTRLAPRRIVGAMMGIWFLAAAFAHYIGALIAKLTSAPHTGSMADLPPVATISLYAEVFTNIAQVAAVVGFLLLTISPLLKRWMHQHPLPSAPAPVRP
jgi:POT family proton-dependent oligopeptide transporter